MAKKVRSNVEVWLLHKKLLGVWSPVPETQDSIARSVGVEKLPFI